MGKARHQPRPYSTIRRRAASIMYIGTADVLDSLLKNFKPMIELDDHNGITEPELRHTRAARAEIRMATRRLRAVGEMMKRG